MFSPQGSGRLLNIVLTGFMGCGKSTVAKILSRRLQLPVADTDDIIVEREKRPIKEIFSTSGEGYFREVEKNTVKELSKKDGLIISTGGGVVMDDENVRALRQNGIIFFLKISAKTAFARAGGTTGRPLMDGRSFDEIEKLLKSRTPKYEAASDEIIQADDLSAEQAAEKILKIFLDKREK